MFLAAGPAGGPTLLLAHGAGAPMDSDAMNRLAATLAAEGVRTLRFEFPYMAARRADGRKRPPDRMPKLETAFRTAYDAARAETDGPLFVGGKSMGGRVASMLADALGAAGVACFGYPFHPPGKPDRLRTDHLLEIATPVLICQGERDPFGGRAEVEAYRLSPNVRFHWVVNGDHDGKPRKASGHTHIQNVEAMAQATARFMAEVA